MSEAEEEYDSDQEFRSREREFYEAFPELRPKKKSTEKKSVDLKLAQQTAGLRAKQAEMLRKKEAKQEKKFFVKKAKKAAKKAKKKEEEEAARRAEEAEEAEEEARLDRELEARLAEIDREHEEAIRAIEERFRNMELNLSDTDEEEEAERKRRKALGKVKREVLKIEGRVAKAGKK